MLGVGVAVTRGVGVAIAPAPPTTWLAGGIWICTGWLIETITRTMLIRVFFPTSTRLILRAWCWESTQTVNLVDVMPLDIMADRTRVRVPPVVGDQGQELGEPAIPESLEATCDGDPSS